jgi:hypothetical protein
MSCYDACCDTTDEYGDTVTPCGPSAWQGPIDEVPTGRHSFGALNELKRDLPKLAEALSTEERPVKPEDLVVHRSWKFHRQYMSNNELRDTAITKLGVGDLPFIQVDALHRPEDSRHDYVGDGYVVYTTRGERPIRYIAAHIPYGNNYNLDIHIFVKGDVFFYVRHTTRMNQRCADKHPPILEGNLLQDIIDNTVGFLMRRKQIEKYGVKIRRGILLSGEAGNGKTMACRWIQKICTENGIEWGTINAAQIERTFAEGHPLDDLFNQYTVTFYDDIDIEYLNRKQGSGKLACSILTAMDGFTQTDHIIRIFTTNETLNSMDEAFVRPGRIDRSFIIRPPNADLRRKLVVERWPQEIMGYLGTGKLDELIVKSEGFSFAELECIRSLLVANKLIGNHGWDLYRAFEDYYNGRETLTEGKNKTSLGFNK